MNVRWIAVGRQMGKQSLGGARLIRLIGEAMRPSETKLKNFMPFIDHGFADQELLTKMYEVYKVPYSAKEIYVTIRPGKGVRIEYTDVEPLKSKWA